MDTQNLAKALGTLMRECRLLHGFTLKEMAKKTGLSETRIKNFESNKGLGKQGFTMALLLAFSDAFDLHPPEVLDELYFRVGDQKESVSLGSG